VEFAEVTVSVMVRGWPYTSELAETAPTEVVAAAPTDQARVAVEDT
jgi:hypothetical protein